MSHAVSVCDEKEITRRVNEFKLYCRAHSLRLTGQRLEIFRAVASSCSHPCAEAVYQVVRKKLPKVSLDTVYRTLSRMEEAGVIGRVGLGNKGRFDANPAAHYHFVCLNCGEVYDVFPREGEKLSLPGNIAEFGEVKNVNLQFRGICNRCRQTAGDVKII